MKIGERIVELRNMRGLTQTNLARMVGMSRGYLSEIETGKKVLSFNTVEFTKLPVYMQETERLKFSVEQRQLLLNPDKKPSKFFLRWVKDAKFPDSIKPKIEEILSRTQVNS